MDNNNAYPPQLDILLADDDKDDCLIFQDALEELPILTTFKAVHDGEQLMGYLSNRRKELPTVLFLDLNMPRKNGLACLEEIKGNQDLNQIPVIIFSTSYDKKIADHLYNMGALYYISKPADFFDLKKTIEQALHLISKGKTKQPPPEKFLLKR